MDRVPEYRVVAHNTATASSNGIHDDVVARRYGFAGGLVPGVDVYAYLTHPPAETWGRDWLRHGSMRARFLRPVYDGEDVVVVPGAVVPSPSGRVMSLELRDSGGTVRATGEARLPEQPAPVPSVAAWRDVEQANDPPVAAPSSLATGAPLGLATHRFDADRAADYLADVRESLPLYATDRIAHPGWLLRDANYVLSANVRLGPWIHLESMTQHHGLVHHGGSIDTRATVAREWESKGHRFVELDVGFIADGNRVVGRVSHTAIYRPRAPR